MEKHWILTIIGALNLISIIVRITKGTPVGSPIYIIIIFAMVIIGISLISKSNAKSN